jgi:hypothetical protein
MTACAIGQAVSLHFLSLKGQVLSQYSPWGVCNWQKWHCVRFYPKYFCSPLLIIHLPLKVGTRPMWRQSLKGISLSLIQKLKCVIYCKIKIWKVNLTALLLYAGCRHNSDTFVPQEKSHFVRPLVLTWCYIQYLHLSKRTGNLL